jgi:hypothetical protein
MASRPGTWANNSGCDNNDSSTLTTVAKPLNGSRRRPGHVCVQQEAHLSAAWEGEGELGDFCLGS